MHMFDEQNGYGCSADHRVMITSNGGAAWDDVTPQAFRSGSGSVYFVDAKTGWVFELQPEKSAPVYGTRDGGRSWSKLTIVPVKMGDGGLSIAFADVMHGWFEGLSAGNAQLAGELFATSDGGKTWQLVAVTPFLQQAGLPFGGALTAQQNGTIGLSAGQREGNQPSRFHLALRERGWWRDLVPGGPTDLGSPTEGEDICSRDASVFWRQYPSRRAVLQWR